MSDQTVQGKFTAVGGGEIHLGITRKPITAWGGMAVFAAFAHSVGLRRALDRTLECLGRVSPNALPASDHMLAFMVGVLTGSTRFLHLERLRTGKAASANNAIAFMDECLALVDGITQIRLVRADSGFFDTKFLSDLEKKKVHYLIKGRMTKFVKLAVLGVTEWTRVGRGIEVGEARIQLMGWPVERRLVVIRQEEATKETPALGKALFECKGYRFQAIVTSLPLEDMDATTGGPAGIPSSGSHLPTPG